MLGHGMPDEGFSDVAPVAVPDDVSLPVDHDVDAFPADSKLLQISGEGFQIQIGDYSAPVASLLIQGRVGDRDGFGAVGENGQAGDVMGFAPLEPAVDKIQAERGG